MLNTLSTSKLIAMLKGDKQTSQQAIQQLMRKNEGSVFRYVLAKGGSREDAEDVFQEGLADLIINVRKGRFQMKSSIHTYLISICKYKWMDRLKREQLAQRYQAHQQGAAGAAAPQAAQHARALEAREELAYWLSQLKEGCKQVLLYWAEGYDMTEIARMMGYKSRQVAMNKKSACLKALHAYAGKYA